MFIFNCQKRHLPSFGLKAASLALRIRNFAKTYICTFLHLLCQRTGINFQGSSCLPETRQNLDLMCSKSLRQIYWATKLPYKDARVPNTKVQLTATSYLEKENLFISQSWCFQKLGSTFHYIISGN